MSESRPFQAWPMADHGVLCGFDDRIDLDLSQRIARLASALAGARLTGVTDLIPSYTTLLILLEPGQAEVDFILDTVAHRWRDLERHPAADGDTREVVIPVAYGGVDGPDLGDVARHTGLTPDEVIRVHSGGIYRVGAIGFAPGFPFLVGLPPDIAIPRRPTPRVRIPVGSVAIGGQQTGVYSCPTPGGWSLIGRTTLALFDPERDPPALLQVGDTIRFEPVGAAPSGLVGPARFRRGDPEPVPRRSRGIWSPLDRAILEVLAPGVLTTVQDLGRMGHGRSGVSTGGAADRASLVFGNRLVGNDDKAAGLELTLTGPHLRFLRPARIALTGADLDASLQGLRVPPCAVRVVHPGDELTFGGRTRGGARAYLCIAGGIDVPERLGSRATDLVGGFGGYEGRPLRRGDRLQAGQPGARPARVDPLPQPVGPIRIVCGPQADRFDHDIWNSLLQREFTISPQSNRQGIRLIGPSLVPRGEPGIISQGVVTGAIQITGGGQPIVMLPARATIGGYPQIATVIAADLDRLGQLKPGDRIRFEEVSLADIEGRFHAG